MTLLWRPRALLYRFCCCCVCLFQHGILPCSDDKLHRVNSSTSCGRDELRGALDEGLGHQLVGLCTTAPTCVPVTACIAVQ